MLCVWIGELKDGELDRPEGGPLNTLGNMASDQALVWKWFDLRRKRHFIGDPDDQSVMEFNAEHIVALRNDEVSDKCAPPPCQGDHSTVMGLEFRRLQKGKVFRHVRFIARRAGQRYGIWRT